jgi:glucose dehydrogenase
LNRQAQNQGFDTLHAFNQPKVRKTTSLCWCQRIYSKDSGNSWKQFSKDTTFFTIRFVDENTAIAAGKDRNRIVVADFR